MYVRKRRYTKKKSYKPTKKSTVSVRRKYSSKRKVYNLAKRVKKIEKSAEVKIVRREAQTLLSSPQSALLANQIWCVNPTVVGQDPKAQVITQGTGQANRVGNTVTTKSNSFKFTALLTPWNVSTNAYPSPMYLKYWIVSVRGGQTYTNQQVRDLLQSKFFQADNSYTGFSDSVMDNIRPVNKDVFYVHTTKTFKLGNATYMASGAGGATPTSNQGFTNNDFKMSVTWTIPLTKFTTKNLKFNDTDSVIYNSTKWLFFTIAHADGTTIGANTPVQLYYNQIYKFTDA